MLAKPLEDRYQDAREVARDLRECERSLASPPAGPGSARPAGLASGTHPEMMTTQQKAVMLAQTFNRTRQRDNHPDQTAEALARGVSNSFDSNEATQRLAVLTGAATAPQTATQALGAVPHAPRRVWRRRDWLLVGGAALAGLVVAGTLVGRRRS